MSQLFELAEGAGGILPTTSSSSLPPSYMRCLQPYRHAHSTATKGRWLKKPLLEVFAREFAVVGDLNGVDSTQDDVPVVPTVSTDPIVNAFLYARELVDGTLYIERGEKECKAAGKAYIDFLKDFDPHTGKRHNNEQNTNTTTTRAEGEDGVVAEEGTVEEDVAVNWTLDKFTNSDGTVAPKSDADIDAFFNALPKLLVLKQSNRFVHVVNRSEHSVNLTDGPIEIAHIARHRKNGASSASASPVEASKYAFDLPSSASSHVALPPSYVAVSKPSSIGIHPAGRFQKNTLLKIVEEIFNGGVVVNKGGAAHTSQRGKLLYGLLVKDTVIDVESHTNSTSSSPPRQQRFTDIFEPLFQRSEDFSAAASSSSSGPPKVYSLVSPTTSSPSPLVPTEVSTSNDHLFEFSPVPTIRIPHSKISEEDRLWLLSKILLQDLKSSTNGDVMTVPSMHGDRRVVFGSEELKTAVVEAAASTRGQPDAVPLKLFIVHRLDRCTSGIIILALDGKSATAITDTFAASEKETPIATNNESENNNNNTTTAGCSSSGWTFTSTGARVVTNTSCDTSKRNKQYLAKVYGDMRQLIQRLATDDDNSEESGGFSTTTFIQAILPVQPSSSSSSSSPTSTNNTIITNGAIYCASCQLAQYWCLGPVEQQRYEDYLKSTANENCSHTLGKLSAAITTTTTPSSSSGKRSREEGGGDPPSTTTDVAETDSINLASNINSCVEKERVQGDDVVPPTVAAAGADKDTTGKKGGGENGEWLTFTGVKENRAAVWERVYGRRGINGPAPLLDKEGNPISQDAESAHFNNFLKLKSAVSSLTVVAVTKVDPVTLKEVQVPLNEGEVTQNNNHDNGSGGSGGGGGDVFYSFVACTPHTGRTHQLRIHLAACGYPIVKDTKYQQYLRRLQEEAATSNTTTTKAENGDVEGENNKKEEGGGGDFLDPEIICLHAHSYTLPIQKATPSTTTTTDIDEGSKTTAAAQNNHHLTVVTAEAPSWYLGPRDFTSLHTQ